MNNYNHVGRPTNEEVLNKKRKGIFKVVLVIVLLLILGSGVFIFINKDNIDFSSIMGNSSTTTTSINRTNSQYFKKVFDASDDTYNILTAGAGVESINSVYFSATSSNNSIKKTQLYTYDVNKKMLRKNGGIFSADNMKNDFVIDIATMDNTNYYLSTSQETFKSQISFSSYGSSKFIELSNIKDIEYIASAYNKSRKKFVSLYKEDGKYKIHEYSVNTENNGKNASISNQLYYFLDASSINDNITFSGMASTSRFLYCTVNENVSGTNYNYIYVYDFKTAKAGNQDNYPLKLIKKIYLGQTTDRYELKSIFYLKGYWYLGYNNKSKNKISFYIINLSPSDTDINISKKISDDGKNITLTTSVKDKSDIGILYYSFCAYKDISKCKLKQVTDSNNLNISNNFSISETVKNFIYKGSNTYYFHIYNIFGKRKTKAISFHNYFSTTNSIFSETKDTLSVKIYKKNRANRTGFFQTHIYVKDAYNQFKVGHLLEKKPLTAETILEQNIVENKLTNKLIFGISAGGISAKYKNTDGSVIKWGPAYLDLGEKWNFEGRSPIKYNSDGKIDSWFVNNLPKNPNITYGMRKNGWLAYYKFNGVEDDKICRKKTGAKCNKEIIAKAVEDGVMHSTAFTPVLVLSGKSRSNNSEGWKSKNFRQAICQIDKEHFIILTDDYHQTAEGQNRDGFSFNELADYMVELGCKTGFNLDGGGSIRIMYKPNDKKDLIVLNSGDGRIATDVIYFTD